MPRLERARVVTYVNPWVGTEISNLANQWSTSVSNCVEILIRWGAYALAVEQEIQTCDIGVASLQHLVETDKWPVGPIEAPSRSVERAADDALRGQLRDMRQRFMVDAPSEAEPETEEADTDAEDDRLARLIREIVREELAAQG